MTTPDPDRDIDTLGLREALLALPDRVADAVDVVTHSFGGIVMPTTVFISADGKVLEVHNGAFSAADLRSEVHKLFGA